MIPDSIPYNKYIDRSKLTEQEKPFVYIVRPSTSGSQLISSTINGLSGSRVGYSE